MQNNIKKSGNNIFVTKNNSNFYNDNIFYEELRIIKLQKIGVIVLYTGIVKWFDNEKGYGFISGNDGKDVFVHHTQVKEKNHNKDLHEGQQVMFDIVEKEKGPQAINVQKMD